MIHTPQKIIELIYEEYEFLHGSSVEVVKQFDTFGNTKANTFLIKSSYPGLEFFVAKGHGLKPEGLKNEWISMQHLPKDFPSPKLLVPEHEPDNILLLQYIKSINAEDLLKKNYLNKLFRSIGQITGKLHSIPVKAFGTFISPSTENWYEFQKSKIETAMRDIKGIIDEDLYNQTYATVQKSLPVLQTDSKAPVFVHHDIYINNFIFDEQQNGYLIDYAISLGGRQLYDFAKFYIIDLYNYPEYVTDFLQGYKESQVLPDNFKELLRFYLLRESLGIIRYANKHQRGKFLDDGVTILKELMTNEGKIINLIETSC